MPPISQFPPARVFLKTSASRPSSIATNIRTPLASNPQTPRFATSFSPQTASQATMQQSSGMAASMELRRPVVNA